MTQFQTTLIAAPPRKTAEPLSVRMRKALVALRFRWVAFFAPLDAAEDAADADNIELRAW